MCRCDVQRRCACGEVGFWVGAHDPTPPLSIDPVLEAAAYFGGSADDELVATDGPGTLVGTTNSIDAPGAPFARRKGKDVLVRVGQQSIIIIGGSGDTTVTSAALNPYYPSSILVGGYTDARDLPTTVSQYANLGIASFVGDSFLDWLEPDQWFYQSFNPRSVIGPRGGGPKYSLGIISSVLRSS